MQQFDWITLLLLLGIVGIGLVTLLHSTALPYAEDASGWAGILERLQPGTMQKQLMWVATGLVLMCAAIALDYDIIARFASVIYWTCMVLLVAVLIFGSATHGTKGWFVIGSQKMQPSEFAKLGMIIALAKVLAQHKGPITRFSDLLPALFYFALPFLLVLMQGDLGTAIVFVAILIGDLFMAQVSGKLLAVMFGVSAAAIPPVWMYFLKDYQKERITSFMNPEQLVDLDATAASKHLSESKIAVGSGQLTGKGIFSEATRSQLDFLSVKTSDFAFAAAAEAIGFLGCFALIAMYALLCLRCLYMATQAKDKFGSLIIVGFVTMILFHVLENIGMCIGIMPITGIPLPFFSYGGSSMWASMIGLGLVLNVSMRRNKTLYRGQGRGSAAYDPNLEE